MVGMNLNYRPKILFCAFIVFCTAISANAELAPGGWNPVVRERLNALIERNRGNPDAYAVFDFDYTAAIGDLSYVCMWELLESFALKVDDFHALMSAGLGPQYKSDIDASAILAGTIMGALNGSEEFKQQLARAREEYARLKRKAKK